MKTTTATDEYMKAGEVENPRRRILYGAEALVNGDRNRQYGSPSSDFARTAAFWNTYLTGVFERKLKADIPPEILEVLEYLIDSHDVAILMNLLKISRISWSPEKEDSWLDGAGYLACGWNCVVDELQEP